MDRYSYLWGNRGTSYREIGKSEGLDKFLTYEIGAQNNGLVISETLNMLGDFQLDQNQKQEWAGQNERPVNVRYAPMHLYKKARFSSTMKPFCAISANGLDYSTDGREVYYKFITFMNRKDLLESADGFNYLDQIFGTIIFSQIDSAEAIKGNAAIDYDALPQKIAESEIDAAALKKDWKVISLAVTALYLSPDYRIVIKLKNGDNVMRRGMSLLKKIYSLLPPMMAFETGFSLYEKPEKIIPLAKDVNTRIFVVTAGSGVEAEKHFPAKTILIDLNGEIPANPDAAFEKALAYWAGMKTWSMRQQAMEKAFTDPIRFFEKEYFLEVTKAFQGNEFFKRAGVQESFPDFSNANAFIGALSKKYQEYHTIFKPVTETEWGKAMFKQMFEKSLPADINISAVKQNLQNLAEQCEANPNMKDSDKQKQLKAFGMLGRWMNQVWDNPLEDQKAVYEAKLRKQDQKHAEEVDSLNAVHAQAIKKQKAEKAASDAAYETKLSEQKDSYEDKLVKQAEKAATAAAAVAAAHATAIEEKQAAIDAAIAKQGEIEEAGKAALAAANEKAAEEKAAQEAAHQEALNLKQEEAEKHEAALKQAYKQKLAEKNAAMQEIQNQLNAAQTQNGQLQDKITTANRMKAAAEEKANAAAERVAYLEGLQNTDVEEVLKELNGYKQDNQSLTREKAALSEEVESLDKNGKTLKIAIGAAAALAVVGLACSAVFGMGSGKNKKALAQAEAASQAQEETIADLQGELNSYKTLLEESQQSLFKTLPEELTANEDETVTLTAGSIEEGASYMWQKLVEDQWTVVGDDTNILTITASLKNDKAQYRCFVLLPDGRAEYCEPVTLTVIPQAAETTEEGEAAEGEEGAEGEGEAETASETAQ